MSGTGGDDRRQDHSCPEQSESARIAMHEGATLYRSDLAIAEETAQGHIVHMAGKGMAIVVWTAVQVHPAPSAGEQQ